VYGYFSNGGGTAYVVRVGGPAQADAPVAEPVALGGFQVRALPGVTDPVTVEIADADGENPPEDRFSCWYARTARVVETLRRVDAEEPSG